VARTLDEECGLLPGQRLLLAVSGGTDSTALLHVMGGLAAARGLVLFAHGVDHGLRTEASAELDQVAELARRLNVPFTRSSVTVPAGGNVQAHARDVRYEALRHRAAQIGSCHIVTAHHADDRAETVLLRLLRGTGLNGLGVIAAKEGDLLRPLLRARRSDILAHLARHELPYATDPSNLSPKYARVRVRREVLPLLEQLNPNIVQHLCCIADEAIAHRLALVDGGPSTSLGRQQRVALERAIAQRQLGFQLPVAKGLRLILEQVAKGAASSSVLD
jgi:tRNA(Ile)-lysidine synthase